MVEFKCFIRIRFQIDVYIMYVFGYVGLETIHFVAEGTPDTKIVKKKLSLRNHLLFH